MSRFIYWIEAMRQLMKSTVALATVLFVASLPFYRGGVLPEDRRRLLDMLALLAGAFVLSWLINTIIQFWRRNRSTKRVMIKKSESGLGDRLVFWLLAVLVYGWLAALLPRGMVHAQSGAIFLLENPVIGEFGSVSQSTSVAVMHFYSLAAALLIAVRFYGRDPFWRRMFRCAVTVAGTLASGVGMWTHLGLPFYPLWDRESVPANVFGFFWYHANAASFLLLTLPMSGWELWSSIQQKRSQLGRVLLLICISLQVCGLLVNFSKVGHVLLVLQAVLLGLFGVDRLRHDQTQPPWAWQRSLIIAAPVFALVGLVAWANGAEVLEKRWDDFERRNYRDEGRVRAAAVSWQMARHAPFGWGPGTFEAVFAHYSAADSVLNRSRWKQAHNDYAQVAAEWGWWGGLILISGPILVVWRLIGFGMYRRGRVYWKSSGVFFPALGLVCLLLHAWVDFPLQNPVILCLAAVVAGLLLAGAGVDHKVGARIPVSL